MSSSHDDFSETRGKADPWSYVQQWDVEANGEVLLDPEERRRWGRAYMLAGGLPYMWKRLAPNISEITYSLLELKRGDRVLLIGEAVEPCGWKGDLEAIVGPDGTVDAIEIIRQGRQTIFEGKRGRNGALGCWQWDYTFDTPEETYDGIAIMQSAQHCDDWAETGSEFLRVLKPGKRIVSAEALIQGSRFESHIDTDVHIQEWYDKMVAAVGFSLAEVPSYTAEELKEAFGERVQDSRAMDWRGIEIFWGRKPAAG